MHAHAREIRRLTSALQGLMRHKLSQQAESDGEEHHGPFGQLEAQGQLAQRVPHRVEAALSRSALSFVRVVLERHAQEETRVFARSA